MSEDDYRRVIALAQWEADTHLKRLLIEWRRELWPDPLTDPISREDSLRRLRRRLAIDGYWGAGISRRPMFGGICGA